MGLRAYLGVALAVVLALTGQSMALARTAPAPAGEIVLCTGSGTTTIAVDAQGRPTGAVHICPDCALSLFDLPAPGSPLAIRPSKWTPLQTPDFIMEFSESAPDFARARDPPDTV